MTHSEGHPAEARVKPMTRQERWARFSFKGATIWFTGLSGSGKSTIAAALERRLVEQGVFAYRLDGDELRRGLNSGLGFSKEDRAENVRRTAEVAALLADSGAVVIASLISPYAADRESCRRIHERAGLGFFEVFVNTPLSVCERRDPKGLYRRARAGEIKGFTGIDDPYEAPTRPDLLLQPAAMELDECVEAALKLLGSGSAIPPGI